MRLIVPVILSGGVGSRLWPVSRESLPKPFVKLGDGETLIKKTYKRVAKLKDTVNPYKIRNFLTVTNREYYFVSREELLGVGGDSRFLLEPCGRNTAPAIALAAHQVQDSIGPDTVLIVISADHFISDDDAFFIAVNRAIDLAVSGKLVTIGITPSSPETGFGYIKIGDNLQGGYEAESFVEKPNFETAQKYIEDGRYLWNTGIFCFTAGRYLEELRRYAPDIATPCARCWSEVDSNSHSHDVIEIPEGLFQEVPNVSIDCAIMEKSNCVAVVKGDFGWSDIGSWNAMRDLHQADHQNNRAYGNAIFVNCKNSFVHTEKRVVAVSGLDDVMIIDTDDALLVMSSKRSQDVKEVTNILRKVNHAALKEHRTVYRPWGIYSVLDEGDGFKIKIIKINPGASLSLQMHRHRSEHWVVVKGEGLLINNVSEERVLKENESAYIPMGHKHRIKNISQGTLVMIEIQCGPYLGEDDIVRFEDNYGRLSHV